MGDKESVQIYLNKVTEFVSQMSSYGENIISEDVVSKVLRSLNMVWKHVVPAIVGSKYLSSYTFDELMGSLLDHESWVSKSEVVEEEKTFQVQCKFLSVRDSDGCQSNGQGCGQGRGGYGGRVRCFTRGLGG